jgi:hypothetical protein
MLDDLLKATLLFEHGKRLVEPRAWKGCSLQFGCPVRLLGLLH